MREPRWDHDYRRGQQGELFVERIIQGLMNGTVETKTDDRAAQTGNLYLETECRRSGVYQPSGLAETQAEFWAFVIGDGLIVAPTVTLRSLLPSCRPKSCDRGSHPTRGYVVGVTQLMNTIRRDAVKSDSFIGHPPLPGVQPPALSASGNQREAVPQPSPALSQR